MNSQSGTATSRRHTGVVGPSGSTTDSSVRKRRLRARKACEPCRDRKRKCDGNKPCSNCTNFEYDCHFVSVRQLAKQQDSTLSHPSHGSINQDTEELHNGNATTSPRSSENHISTVEANSAAAFVRKLALALDPANAPRLHLFAWNLFLGSRIATRQPCVRSITEIISHADMVSLASVYLSKVDPCYGFLDHKVLHQRISSRWTSHSIASPYDAVLCGVAAFGYLFSCVSAETAEVDLVESAKYILEQYTDIRPGVDIISAWVLRVAYLRMTASPQTAWMASCSMMHAVEASGLHLDPSARSSPLLPLHNIEPDLRSAMFGIATHLNVWTSFDLGRSRVVLPHAHSGSSSARPGSYTKELLDLLPVLELLAPENNASIDDLKTALRNVINQEHTQPPSVLAQVNASLILVRRIRAHDVLLSGSLLDQVLKLMASGIRSAEASLNTCNPWHHVSNMPFQIVCILLAIDTPASLALLADAIRVLSSIAQIYATEATMEALSTAYLLIHLHQKRKSTDAVALSDVLRTYSSLPAPDVQDHDSSNVNWNGLNDLNEASWLDDLMLDIPNLQDFDMNQLMLGDNAQLGMQTQWPVQ